MRVAVEESAAVVATFPSELRLTSDLVDACDYKLAVDVSSYASSSGWGSYASSAQDHRRSQPVAVGQFLGSGLTWFLVRVTSDQPITPLVMRY